MSGLFYKGGIGSNLKKKKKKNEKAEVAPNKRWFLGGQ